MTFADVLDWCRKNSADVRGIYRGKDIAISHTDQRLPDTLPAIGEIFHWDLKTGDIHHPASASDMVRMVDGELTLEGFSSTIPRG